MQQPTTPTPFLKRSWPALAVAAAFLVGANLGGSFTTGAASAAAQPEPGTPTNTPPFNAMEQRNRMITQLEQMNRRLQTIEAKLNAGISVKVTEMPPVTVKEQPGK